MLLDCELEAALEELAQAGTLIEHQEEICTLRFLVCEWSKELVLNDIVQSIEDFLLVGSP